MGPVFSDPSATYDVSLFQFPLKLRFKGKSGVVNRDVLVKEKEEENTARGNKSNSSSSRNSSEAGQVEWNSSMVYLLKASDETANTTLLVIKGGVKVKTLPSPSPSQGGSLKAPVGKKKAIRSVAAESSEATCKTNREEIIQEWLAVR